MYKQPNNSYKIYITTLLSEWLKLWIVKRYNIHSATTIAVLGSHCVQNCNCIPRTGSKKP